MCRMYTVYTNCTTSQVLYIVLHLKTFIQFMLALFRILCNGFMPWLYSWIYIVALDHGFILGFMLGVMSLMFQAAPCELNQLVQGARYSADSANLVCRMPLAN